LTNQIWPWGFYHCFNVNISVKFVVVYTLHTVNLQNMNLSDNLMIFISIVCHSVRHSETFIIIYNDSISKSLIYFSVYRWSHNNILSFRLVTMLNLLAVNCNKANVPIMYFDIFIIVTQYFFFFQSDKSLSISICQFLQCTFYVRPDW